MTATPDQVIAQIREALEAGPTPGEWVIDKPNPHLVAKLVDGAYEYICAIEPSTFSTTDRAPHEDDANARFIAACNPQNIAVILGEIKDLQSVVHAMNEDFAAMKAEREALLKALEPFSKIAGEMFARNWHAKAIVVALDTPEDSHRLLAGDFFHARTLSGDKSWTAK